MKLFFYDNKLILDKEGVLPEAVNCDYAVIDSYRDFDGEEITLCLISEMPESAELIPVSLRDILESATMELYARAGRAFQIKHWRETYRYCPGCGVPLVRKQGGELVMQCPECKHDYYPRINPAVIAAIENNGRILLAERSGTKGPFYSLIAGFIEAGESAEDAIRREAKEEVGITIDSLTYVKSQPWPFPSGLMLGYMATTSDTEIRPDGQEVAKDAFYQPDALPSSLPAEKSIASYLITKWLRGFVRDNSVQSKKCPDRSRF